MWRLIDLGAQDGFTIQTVYEAVARYDNDFQNTLILCYPKEPYVCPGVHQVIEKEIDIKFCRAHNMPIVRRQVGGGTVFNDTQQQFYQIIVKKEDSPLEVKDVFKKFLKPAVHCYKKFALDAEYKPLNDIVIGGKKASGNGAMSLGGVNVLIGNILIDPDVRLMTSVLKVPSEKFRDKIAESISEWMTSLRKELGFVPDRELIKEYYIDGFKELGIEFDRGSLKKEEEDYIKKLTVKFKGNEWIYKRELEHFNLLSKVDAECKKVKNGVLICEASFKAEKLIRITMETIEDKITEIFISGDFFVEPVDGLDDLEKELIGCRVEKEALTNKIDKFFKETGINAYGATSADFAEAIVRAKKKVL